MLTSVLINTIATTMASESHTEWLNNYRKNNGNMERIKSINSEEFNINVEWNDLHYLWQSEQMKIFIAYLNAWKNDYDIEEYSAIIHEIWLQFNSWCDDSLKVPYEMLSDDEKEKDRVVARKINYFIINKLF